MRYTILFFSLLLYLSVFSCKKNDKVVAEGESFFADLFVRYLEEEGQLKATATFFKGDSLPAARSWQASSDVLFDGRPMKERNIQGSLVRYILELNSRPDKNSFQLGLRDESAPPLELAVSLDPIQAFSIQGAASRSEGIHIDVQNGQLNEHQSLVFLFSDAENKAHSVTVPGPHQGNLYFLSPQRIADWPEGKGQLYLVKKSNLKQKAGEWEVLLQTEYYTDTQELIMR